MAILDLLIMRKGEVVLNLSLGVSIISWGGAGISFHYLNGEPSLLRLLIAVMNFIIGLLIIFRKPMIKMGSLTSVMISFPSIILGGLAFKMAPPLDSWPIYAEITFFIGAFSTLISFIFLGRNFAIFPGLRSIVSNGTYNIVRHPGYLGELIMTFACIISRIGTLNNLILILFLLSLSFRINEEEKLLSQNSDYVKYKEKVKWKLFPYLW